MDSADAPVSCSQCEACCCRLEVMLFDDARVPDALTTTNAWGATVMARLEDGWCVALDRNDLRCTIYAVRPQVCRDYAMGGHECRAQRADLMPRS